MVMVVMVGVVRGNENVERSDKIEDYRVSLLFLNRRNKRSVGSIVFISLTICVSELLPREK